jgi:hypothetical protein
MCVDNLSLCLVMERAMAPDWGVNMLFHGEEPGPQIWIRLSGSQRRSGGVDAENIFDGGQELNKSPYS